MLFCLVCHNSDSLLYLVKMFVNTDLKYIWKNGSYEKWEDSSVHILSHTVHYGTGVLRELEHMKPMLEQQYLG